MSDSIQGKVVVITGASSGLGEATARHLATRGAKVVLGARRTEKLQAICADIQRAGGEATFNTMDVTSLESAKDLVDLAVQTYGKLDVIINNAGLMSIAPLQDRH